MASSTFFRSEAVDFSYAYFAPSREVILTVFPIALSRLFLCQIQCRYVFLMLGYGGEASLLFRLDDFYLYAERFASALL
jgi:hypothetical protein